MTQNKVFKITLRTPDVDAFLAECALRDWAAIDTGERIMTEDGPDGETVLLVETAPLARGERRVPIAQ